MTPVNQVVKARTKYPPVPSRLHGPSVTGAQARSPWCAAVAEPIQDVTAIIANPVTASSRRPVAASFDDVWPTFRSQQLEARFAANGYVVVDFFSLEAVERLKHEVVEFYPPTGGFATSVEIADEPYRRRVHSWLADAFRDRAAELFTDHQMNLTAVAIKWPGEEGLKPIHQDWTFSDETRFRSVNVWVPLVDTAASNGALAVLPGSHRVLSRVRPAPRFPTGYADPVAELDFDDLQSVDIPAGHAIVMDLGLVHGSPVNQGADPRVVVAANFLPTASPISYYYCNADDEIERYAVPDASFFQRFDWTEPPADLVRQETVPFRPDHLTASTLVMASAAQAVAA